MVVALSEVSCKKPLLQPHSAPNLSLQSLNWSDVPKILGYKSTDDVDFTLPVENGAFSGFDNTGSDPEIIIFTRHSTTTITEKVCPVKLIAKSKTHS